MLVNKINLSENKVQFFRLLDLNGKVDYLDLLETEDARQVLWKAMDP